MNLKKNHAPISVKIGKVTIQEEKSAKLLGMTLEGSGEWESHLNGVGGLIPMLNKRLFLIKRLRNHMNYSNVKKVAESIYMSKVMYGLQLIGKIRWNNQDSKHGLLIQLQKTQNKLLRFLNKSKISDKISTKQILENLNMCSINQLNAKIKLTEMWRMTKLDPLPPIIKKMESSNGTRCSRSISRGKLIEEGTSEKSTSTFINDATRAWNKAPENIKDCTSLYSAKKAIKAFVKTLPV